MRSQRIREARRPVWSTTLGVCYLQGTSQGCTAGVLSECVRFPAIQRPYLAVRQPQLCCCSSWHDAETVAVEGCRVQVTELYSTPQLPVDVISQEGVACDVLEQGARPVAPNL